MTLCVVHKPPKILLGMKKRGFGVGRWNGFGGKVKEGESIEDGVRREVLEEAGINLEKISKGGILEFNFEGNPDTIEVNLFRAMDFSGEPQESEEMRPEWFNVNEIPYDSMWPDDRHWLPLFLEGNNLSGKFLFDEKGNEILKKELSIFT